LFFFDTARISFSFFPFWTGFDLNLPLEEFGAVDLDFLQNLPGKIYGCACFFSILRSCRDFILL
jgi:hypothetical protein